MELRFGGMLIKEGTLFFKAENSWYAIVNASVHAYISHLAGPNNTQ